MVRAVLFDIGGVLIENPSERRYKKYAKICHENIEEVKRKIRKKGRLLDTGKIPSQEFWSYTSRELGISKELFRKIWVRELVKCKDKTNALKLAKVLKSKGYNIGLLSNTSNAESRVHTVKKLFPLFRPNLFLSFRIGHRKPSEKIFRFASRKMRLSPEEIVFIDNKKENVEGAARIGIIGLHFTSYRKLVKDLKRVGVV